MALNLWKVAGKPTSYNPLPSGSGNVVYLQSMGSYHVSFRAKSTVNNDPFLLQYDDGSPSNELKTITCSTDFQWFTWDFTTVKSNDTFYFLTGSSTGSITIDSISLVQKPLPKLTVNGVDGFLSGKWTFSVGTSVIDDQTLNLTISDGSVKESYIDIPVLPSKVYTFSAILSPNAYMKARTLDSNKNGITDMSYGTANSITKTTESNCAYLRLLFSNNYVNGTFTFSKPMLNLGSTPSPYSKKTGDKMVMPVARKNIFDGKLEIGGLIWADGTLYATSDRVRSVNYIPIGGGKKYVISNSEGIANYVFYDANKNYIGYSNTGGANAFTSPNNAGFIKLVFTGTTNVNTIVQLEQGTTATPYAPYATMPNKQPARTNANGQPAVVASNKGLRFNGTSDYIATNNNVPLGQNAHITADFSTLFTPPGNAMIVDQYPTGGGYGYSIFVNASGYVCYRYGNLSYNSSVLGNDGVKHRAEIVVKNGVAQSILDGVVLNSQGSFDANSYVNPATIGARNNSGMSFYFSGTIYNVYIDNGVSVLVNYDLTNAKNIVGTTVIPSAKNLIPSFEDPRWSIHANAKVMGRDCLHLDATGSFQSSVIFIPVMSGKSYLLSMNPVANEASIFIYKDADSNFTTYVQECSKTSGHFSVQFTPDSSFNGFITLRVCNTGTYPMGYDFINLQLYQLTGNEGTINGNPVQQNKGSKRTLYAKR